MSRTRSILVFLSIFMTVVGLGVFTFVQVYANGESTITNLTLADNDTTGFGLDGRDFHITWNPGGVTPTGMQYAQIFILPDGTNLSTSTINTACSGSSPAFPSGYFNAGMYLTFNNYTPPMYMSADSCNTPWNPATSYRAWIYASTTNAINSFVASSSQATMTSDTVTDISSPFIEHLSVNTALQNTNAIIYAFINDDQTAAGDYAVGTGGAFFTLVYGEDISVASSTVEGVVVSGNLYKFTVPSGFVLTKPSFEYFIKAGDKSGNRSHFCALPPSSSNYNACLVSPFVVNVVASLPRSISGTVLSNGSPVASAYVFAGGVATAATTTNGGGEYTIASLPNNNVVDLTAHKIGFCKMMLTETIGISDKTGVAMNINQGECGFMGGGMGGGLPMVTFSGPSDGMQGVPIAGALRVGFNQTMDSSTINDASSNSTSSDNIYLLNNKTNQPVAGMVAYCANSSAPGCSSLFSMDMNTVLFIPTAGLSTSTSYALIITEKVKSQSGQSVQGNRQGGGHRINFTTVGEAFNMATMGGSYGTSGQFMPPFVRSVNPAPGMSAAGNVKVTVEFDQAMKTDTITTTNIKLKNVTTGLYAALSSATLDSTESRFVKLTPTSSLTNGDEYSVEVYGAVANALGVSMRGPGGGAEKAFSSSFRITSASDNTAPTLYAALASNSTGVPVNQVFEFGASEQLDLDTISTTNITMFRGATAASIAVSYDPSKNSVFVAPLSALVPNTLYTITFGAGVKDQAGNVITPVTYTYTIGSGDTVAPGLREARCDDYKCRMVFTEPMNHDTQADANWANSVTNPANWTIAKTAPSSVTLNISGKPMNYNAVDYSVTVEGVTDLSAGNTYLVTAGDNIKDLSENLIGSTKTFTGIVESSAQTFGQFGGAGMFAPPTTGMMGGGAMTIGGGEFKPQGFGNYTAEQFAFGSADQAFPFNPMAAQDSNVFQIRLKPGVALVTGNKIAITFPSGTIVASAALNTDSPFASDFTEGSNTIVTSSAVVVDTTERKVTITLAVTGTATSSDTYTIELSKIVNPIIPKGPSSGGYTATLQAIQAGVVTATKTSMPYFIEAGGSNTITVDVYAGSGAGVSGANGTVYLHGGGPSGPMDKTLTMVNGQITDVSGTTVGNIVYSNLRDGCYFVGTEPTITLGGVDYFGQMSPEPICVSSGQSLTKNITLTSSETPGASVPITVKLVKDGGFGGKDIDIFAGGPGKYVVKTLTNVVTPNGGGYTLRLPANGHWNIGVQPAMPKGVSTGIPQSLGVMPPPPTDLVVSGLGGTPAVSTGMFTSPGMSFDDTTDTLTITFATANKVISGTVKDGDNAALSNIQVFVNRQGFGAPLFTQTDSSGAFSLSVADNGTYEIGASKQGMPPVFKMIDVRGSGTNYVDGKLVDGGNPFVISMKKASYTISGKILDVDSNSISGASLFASNTIGNSVFGQSGSDGSYTLFVDNGTWTVNVQMPPEKNDACGTFSKTVVVSGASQSSQNVTPTAGTCYTISGTVSATAGTLNNVPLFLEEWNAGTNQPVMNGLKRPASTNSSGFYSVKVLSNKTYRIGTWHPDYGEISATQAVTTSNVTKDITVVSDTVTFNFTSGSSSMNAMIELKDSTNGNKVIRKQINGLASAVVMNIESGSTYNYSVDVFGYGKYSGTVTSTGGADSVTIDLSSDFITISGIVKDALGNALSGAAVSIISTTTNMVVNDLTDSSGAYEIKVKAGSYQMATNLNGFVPSAPTSVSFSVSTSSYDFATGQDQSPLTISSYNIEGNVFNSTLASTSEGFVWATNADGVVISTPIGSDGTYSLPVTPGVWTVKAVGPLHSETTRSGTVTVTAGNQTGKNITLTADATRIPKSATGVLSANTGGSINDTGSSGMKLTVGSGVLEVGSGNVTVNMEQGFNAPDSGSYQTLNNATFSFEASGASTIKTLKGNAEIQIDFSDMTLPAGVSTSSLQLMYYSPERGDYVPVEGGFTVSTTTNTMSGLVNHFTDFVLAYVPTQEGVPAVPTGVTATAVSTSQINIAWSAVSGATSYTVYRSATVGGTYTDISSPSGTSYSDTGRTSATAYYYKITATNGTGEGASSDAASATTQTAQSSGGGGGYSDTTPPTNTSIVIAGGATSTASTSVTLTLTATDASQMMISNDILFTGLLWNIYSTSKVWTLSSGAGVKTVYVKYKDSYNNISDLVSDTINLIGTTTEAVVTAVTTPVVTTMVTATTLGPVTIPTLPANPTTADYQNLLNALLKQVAYLTSQLQGGTTSAISSAHTTGNGYKFTVGPVLKGSGESTRRLQIFLKAEGSEIYPEGLVTGYFGNLTQIAVKKFQIKYSIAKEGDAGFGLVGPKTRAKMNQLQGF